MDGDRWQRIQTLFLEVVDLPRPEQFPFLKSAAGDDEQLIAEVQALLAEDGRPSLLDNGVAHVASRSSDLLPSCEFGPYRIRAVLGEGGMGVVYLAEREDLASLAAIKLLRDAWMSPARRERFAVEQRTLAQLTHPNIARLYDADTLADGTPWFAMEYVQGIPLTEYCRRQGSSIEQRLKLFASVCEAVRYAHSRAIIHRDLKPANILVQSDGSVKLLDFGIAKQLEHRDEPANQTLTGLRLMTPAYAAPEQLRGEPAGTYTDVYALGVVLYELLTGRLPFDLTNRSPGEAEAAILNQQPAKPSTSSDLNVLCLTAMQKDHNRRYQSVEALIRDVNHYLSREPLDARPDGLTYRLGKFVQRHRRSLAVATCALLTVAALVVFYTVRLASARNAALAEAARTQRVLRFTLNLFNGGDREAGPASDLRVATLLDRGVVEAQSLDRDPAVQAELYETLGEVYQKLGALDRADSLLASALQRRRALSGNSDKSVAMNLVNVGLLRADEAKFEEAERLVRQGLQIAKANLPPGHASIAAATDALGTVLEERGSYDQAIQVLKEAVRLRSAPGFDKADLAASLFELANTHFYAGHFAEAQALDQRLLSMHRQIYGPRHPLVAEDLINLGAIQQELGHYPQAEAFHRQALDITEPFYGKDHYKTALNLTLIARALVFENHYDEAAEMLRRAVAIQEKVFGKLHPRVASPLNDLGNIAVRRGKLDEAEADFRRMADIYRAAYAGKHYLIGIALANLGGVYLARKENTRAEALFRQALAMYAQTLPPGSLNEGITRIKLGRTLLRERRFAEAEVESLTGYQLLSKQASPRVSWLQNAREDLVSIYAALREPAKAQKFRAEQAALVRN